MMPQTRSSTLIGTPTAARMPTLRAASPIDPAEFPPSRGPRDGLVRPDFGHLSVRRRSFTGSGTLVAMMLKAFDAPVPGNARPLD